MDPIEQLRATILSSVARDIPRDFWPELRDGAKFIYIDVFHEVRADPNLVENQRIDLLYQMRHCRMEFLLKSLAEKHGIPCSPSVVEKNGRYYVYATNGAIGMTQSYVQTIGAMPKPAKYLDRLAAMNAISRAPQLQLGDEPPEVFDGKDFFGLLAHNPVGKRFTEQDQSLGMIQFCVPVRDNSEWAAQLAIPEILLAYGTEVPSERQTRGPRWRRRDYEEKKGTQ